MKRRAIVASICAVLAALALAGCAGTGAPGTPGATGPTTPPPAASPTSTPIPVSVYFLRAGKVAPVARTVPPATARSLRPTLTALLAGPTSAEASAGLVTGIPAGTKLLGTSFSNGITTIDLSPEFVAGAGTASMKARLAEIVYTATQFSSITGVKFTIDGSALTTIAGTGITLGRAQTRGEFESSTPAILVDSPAWASVVRKGATAQGTANVFEALFRLQVRDSAGTLLVDVPVTASSGTGTRGTWSQTLTWTNAAPGKGELRVFANSAKDGSPIDVVKVQIDIQ